MKWETRLKLAKTNGFTLEDKELAKLWITDPISEFKDTIQLKNNNLALGPVDIYLVLAGIYFTKGIEEDDWNLTWNCYKDIVKRID